MYTKNQIINHLQQSVLTDVIECCEYLIAVKKIKQSNLELYNSNLLKPVDTYLLQPTNAVNITTADLAFFATVIKLYTDIVDNRYMPVSNDLYNINTLSNTRGYAYNQNALIVHYIDPYTKKYILLGAYQKDALIENIYSSNSGVIVQTATLLEYHIDNNVIFSIPITEAVNCIAISDFGLAIGYVGRVELYQLSDGSLQETISGDVTFGTLVSISKTFLVIGDISSIHIYTTTGEWLDTLDVGTVNYEYQLNDNVLFYKTGSVLHAYADRKHIQQWDNVLLFKASDTAVVFIEAVVDTYKCNVYRNGTIDSFIIKKLPTKVLINDVHIWLDDDVYAYIPNLFML